MVSDAIRNPQGRAAQQVLHGPEEDLAISVIVAGELRYGLERRSSAGLAARVKRWISIIPVLPMEEGTDVYYGRIRANLERRGTTIGGNDLLIAAHALALGATLVTDNVREFGRVEGLTVVNWLRD